MIGQFVSAWVQTKDDLKALVDTRIAPQVAGAAWVYPYITYATISDDQDHSLSGPTGRRVETLQIDICDSEYARAKQIAALICGGKSDRRLDGYSVTLGDAVLAGITVREARKTDERDTYDDPQDGSPQGPRRIQLDFKFTYDYLGGA